MNATHIDNELLVGYFKLSVTAATASAIEAHLMSCVSCRAGLANVATSVHDPLVNQESVWAGVVERVDRPTRSIVERLLGLIGVRPETAKLLATTPALRLAWLAAVAFVAGVAVAVARIGSDGPWLLLVVAPLLPIAGVACAYGPALDPTHEIGVAAPMSGLRLVLMRTFAVTATTMPLLAGAALFVPGGGWAAFGWVLPSFALVAMTLALSTLTSPERAGMIAAAGWLVVLVALVDRDRSGNLIDRSLIFSSTGQTAIVVVVAIAVGIVVTRKPHFDLMIASKGRR